MLFSSHIFLLLYLPITFLVFVQLRHRTGGRAAILWITMMSIVFYGWWNINHVFLLIVLLIINYILGLLIWRRRRTRIGKIILIVGVSLNIGVLAWFKYAGFLGSMVSSEFSAYWRLADIALPLAISFFIFQKIAYLVDVWREVVDPPDFLEFCFFVLFFPQLIAGPIVHCRDIVPQIRHENWAKDASSDAAIGLSLLAIGLLKKLFLADKLAITADRVFGSVARGDDISALAAWLGTLSFGFQIYFDFSAYSDMALGLALMFGIRLIANFNSPYKASDPVDFWRRWHISLSSWLRDYLYIPLGGNRGHYFHRFVNVAIVMVLGGLWHGAAWTFLMWGAMHAILILIAHAVRSRFGEPVGIARAVSAFVTFLLVMICWVPFRAADFPNAVAMYSAMFSMRLNFDAEPYLRDFFLLVIAGFVCWVLPNTMQIFGWYKLLGNTSKFFVWRPSVTWSLVVATALASSLAYVQTANKFIYFQF